MDQKLKTELSSVDFIATQESESDYRVLIVDPNSDFGPIGEKLKSLNFIQSERGHYYSHTNGDEVFIFVGNDVIDKDQDMQRADDKETENVLSSLERGYDKSYINKALVTTILAACKSLKTKSFSIELSAKHITRFISLINQYNYKLNTFKQEPEFSISRVDIITEDVEYIADLIAEAEVTSLCNSYANYLADLPANVCTTHFLAEETIKLASMHPACDFEILDESNLKALGMNCLLAVGAGSPQHTYLASLYFKNAQQASNKKTVVIGKGLVYDTGGVNLKPARAMLNAHKDMHGAAAALGTIRAAMMLNLPVNLMVIIALAENSCDGLSMRQGDIVKSMSGKTVKVNHTDAEGRLVLCDTMTYAQRQHHADTIITLATLTGCAVGALGAECYALFANNAQLRDKLLTASVKAEESCWPLPLYADYSKCLKDSRADLANVNLTMEAGCIQGAIFLNNFVEKACTFAHFDIAGTWDVEKPKLPIGTIINLLKQ
jgi:leucyl aminopeptidase